MKYLKYFKEARKANINDLFKNKFRQDDDPYDINKTDTTNTDERIINFNNKLQKIMNQIGLIYEYNPIYRRVIKDGKQKRETESHNYTITLETNKYSIAYYLFKNLLLDNRYAKMPKPSVVCEFSINVSCDTLRTTNQMTLDDNLWIKAVGYMLDFFQQQSQVYFKNIPASKIKKHLVKMIKSTIKSNDVVIQDETILLVNNYILSLPMSKVYKEIDNIKKK